MVVTSTSGGDKVIDWDHLFATAHTKSWPFGSVAIQNRNPAPSNPTARNIFKDDEKQIFAAAKRHGYKVVTPLTFRAVMFVNRLKEAE